MIDKIIALLLLSNLSFASNAAQKPEALSLAEWNNIQAQINTKSLPQSTATLAQSYLKASNVDANAIVGDGGDSFGLGVAIDGDSLVVGARYEDGADDNTQNNSGAAYVFIKNNGIWEEQAILKEPSPTNGDQFGMAVDISGDTIAVSAHLDDVTQSNSGAVYIYTRSMGVWTFQQKIKASNPGPNDFFGYSLSLDSGTLVVGAYQEDGDDSSLSNNYGAAYIFVGSGNSWTFQQKLSASGAGMGIGMGDNFGYSVSISADTVVIGAYKEDGLDNGSENDSGAAYVFQRTGTLWSNQAYLKASNLDAGDNFGNSVGISGDTIVVGAWQEDEVTNNILNAGAAYVFTRSGVMWTEQSILRANNAGFGDFFGNSVAIDGTKIVVGAKFEDGDGIGGLDNNNVFNSGAAYLFEQTGVMVQQTYLKAVNAGDRDEFGIAVAISGNTVIVGAPSEDSAVINDPNDNTFVSSSPPFITGAGAAYVFSPPDLMFIDGFEAPVVVKLFQYLSKIQSNTNLEQVPVYDGQCNSLIFYGHSLKLKNNYDQQDIVEIVKFWLHEVLIEEGLSGQYGLDVIF